MHTTAEKFGITCYIDVFLLSFNNGYFNIDENSIIQTPAVLCTFEIVLTPKEEE